MYHLPTSMIVAVAVLTAFFAIITVLKYSIVDNFSRTRLMMTLFFCFIVLTLTISFKQYAVHTLPFSSAAAAAGLLVGFLVGVPAAEGRLKREGLSRYRENFAKVERNGIRGFAWWNIVNFYTVMSALVLINLVGLSTVIFRGAENWAILTSAVGAFLLGTIVPYLVHLWSIKAAQKKSTTTKE